MPKSPATTMKRTASKLVEKIASDVAETTTTNKAPALKRSRTATSTTSVESSISANIDSSSDTEEKPKKGRNTLDRLPFPREKIDPFPTIDGNRYIRIMSWNVNGLKALVTNNVSMLHNLVEKHRPDILCLQETKIQETMIDEYRDLLPNYCSYWNCSTVKKGYSGTAFFLNKKTIGFNIQSTTAAVVGKDNTKSDKKVEEIPKKKQMKLSAFLKPAPVIKTTTAEETTTPSTADATVNESSKSSEADQTTSSNEPKDIIVERISYDFEDEGRFLPGEGRTITIETNKFIIVGCYVPNSGDGLVRLNYRLNEWDPYLRQYLQKLNARKPVIFTGDLNVGHLDLDIHNPTAKHIVKQAGLTPQERQSFTELLSTKFRDAFRFYYPDAQGQFTYWSQRTFARRTNHGIRLDYFICSDEFFPSSNTTTIITSSSQEKKRESDDTKVEGEETETSSTTVAVRTSIDESSIPLPGVYDSYIVPEETNGCSDHCPVVLVLKVASASKSMNNRV